MPNVWVAGWKIWAEEEFSSALKDWTAAEKPLKPDFS